MILHQLFFLRLKLLTIRHSDENLISPYLDYVVSGAGDILYNSLAESLEFKCTSWNHLIYFFIDL